MSIKKEIEKQEQEVGTQSSREAVGLTTQVRFQPLSSTFGAECIGVDLKQELSPDLLADIHDAFLHHQVLVFRGQELQKEDQMRFSRYFGELELPVNREYWGQDFPELHVVSNLNADGKPAPTKALANPGNYFWHTDASYQKVPSLSTLLYGVQMPSRGGDTSFANMYAAYDTLPDSTKNQISGLRVVHSWEQSRLNSGSRAATEEEKKKAPPVSHPLVRTHPETGRKSLYIGIHTSHIEGIAVDESRTLLSDLLKHATQPEFVYRHRWHSGDLVMWDNRCLLHCASDDFDEREARVLYRTVVRGTVPE